MEGGGLKKSAKPEEYGNVKVSKWSRKMKSGCENIRKLCYRLPWNCIRCLRKCVPFTSINCSEFRFEQVTSRSSFSKRFSSMLQLVCSWICECNVFAWMGALNTSSLQLWLRQTYWRCFRYQYSIQLFPDVSGVWVCEMWQKRRRKKKRKEIERKKWSKINTKKYCIYSFKFNCTMSMLYQMARIRFYSVCYYDFLCALLLFVSTIARHLTLPPLPLFLRASSNIQDFKHSSFLDFHPASFCDFVRCSNNKWNFWTVTQFRNHRWTSFQIFSNRSNRHVRIPKDAAPYSGSIVFSMLCCCRLHQSKYSALDPIRGIDLLVHAIGMYCRSVGVALLLEHPANTKIENINRNT